MTNSRVPLAAAGAIVVVLLVQSILETVISNLAVTQFLPPTSTFAGFEIGQFVISYVLRIGAFGVGVWLSLLYIAPVNAASSWRRAIGRGVIASLVGTAGVVVYAIVWAVFSALRISAYPLGYSLDPSLDTDSLGNNLISAAYIVIPSLIEWLPLVVLAVVLMKAWLASGPAPDVADAKAPASAAAKP